MVNEESGKDFSVRVDFGRILETISAQIYDNQYAFLRENVQNAIDAIRIQAGRDGIKPDDLKFRIDIKIEGNRCIISDNGNGMTRAGLANNFWTMGASGKNTPEAQAAGCIGTFGIGGFANFGVCDKLEVISRTSDCAVTHHTSLSKAAFNLNQFSLPVVEYCETQELASRGTTVIGTTLTQFDAPGLTNYLKQFVKHVREQIYINNDQLISRESVDKPSGNYREIAPSTTAGGSDLMLTFQVFADDGDVLSAKISGVKINGKDYTCNGYVRLVHGQLDVFKRGFRLCSVNISSRIGITGSIDCDILQPTAGRDTLDGKSLAMLTRIFQLIENFVRPLILEDAGLLANHIRLLPDFISQGLLEKLRLLEIQTLNNNSLSLGEIRDLSEEGQRVLYSVARGQSAAAEVLQARGNIIVSLTSNNPQRRKAEISYLSQFCKATEFDNFIECLEPYDDLDSFEKGVLAELDMAIRKLFKPGPYFFIAGKLTLDVPIFWTNKKEKGSTLGYVDTRHGEFQKLRPLGYTSLLWSMIEAFCREYLGDTLKRQSPKFFGSGAIDLDTFSKSHVDLWELVSTDIAESLIIDPDKKISSTKHPARIEIVHIGDVAHVTISKDQGVNEQTQNQQPSNSIQSAESLPKLLHINDETGVTGLTGYYLRIPVSATLAFGELIRTFPSFAVVWFANRVTWSGSDMNSTAFVFDVTLDRMISANGTLAQGAMELGTSKVQMYREQIYFFIPQNIQDYLVPTNSGPSIKIEIRHELIDLTGSRSWTAKNQP